jgi:small subunit ribosomal protein S6e
MFVKLQYEETVTTTQRIHLDIANPTAGICQDSSSLDSLQNHRKLRVFMEKRMGNDVPADSLGDEWKGYV